MSQDQAQSKGRGAAKTAAIGIVAYAVGLAVSPHVLSADFLSSLLQRRQQQQQRVNQPPSAGPKNAAPTPTSPPLKLPGQPAAVPSLSPHERHYRRLVGSDTEGDPFLGVDLILHRNGEPDPCFRQQDATSLDEDGTLSAASRALLRAAAAYRDGKPLGDYSKYDVDAALTHALAHDVLPERGEACGPTRDEGGDGHYLDRAPHPTVRKLSPLIKFCDMGPDRTPVQLDHARLERVPSVGSLPCHFHTREGVRVTSVAQLARLAREAAAAPGDGEECAAGEDRGADGTCGAGGAAGGGGGDGADGRRALHLYAVSAGRVFIFAPRYVGEVFHLPHVRVPGDLPVSLVVLSLSPRVFDVINFFDREESAKIVAKALAETSETHRIKRSSTGASGYNVNSQRTSENGFDTHGKEAQAVKRRCMHVLGFDEYEESLTDGLQVLRYNRTTAYIPHLDWIDDYGKQQEHDFDTEHQGSNRFATILLYMSDLNEGDGGETVFTHAWPVGQPEEERVPFERALADLRAAGDVAGLLQPDSWQEQMVARCRSRLAVRPHSSRAVLFYSQHPDGTLDNASMHGGCPVISGEKWAANLWAWNAPRGGFPGSPVNKEVVERNRAKGQAPVDNQKKASFHNGGTDEGVRNAKLYFQDTFWGDLGFGDPPLHVNTFAGHQWNVKVGETTVQTFVADKRPTQVYTI